MEIVVKVLHICSYYIGNKLYMSLIKQLSEFGIEQDVFIPIKNNKMSGQNQIQDVKTIRFFYQNIISIYDRFLFFTKVYKQYKQIEKLIMSNSKIDVIHAHTIFSDGSAAYKLHKKYGIPYIINVRNTDINIFYKFALHLRPLMYKILIHAEAIVFISPSYQQKLMMKLPAYVSSKIEKKCYVISNGIDQFWHRQSTKEKSFDKNKSIVLIYVGRIDKNKNLETVINMCAILRNLGYSVLLNVIGSGPLEYKMKKLCSYLDLDDQVKFYGYVSNPKELLAIMDQSDIYVMPSFKETFGLVYIEAMSRGLPVIYTKNEGIDGYFTEGEVGYSVTPNNADMIAKSVIKAIKDYDAISKRCIAYSKLFNWNDIAKKYISLYKRQSND